MVVAISKKQSYFDQLLCAVRKKYKPKNVTVEELAESIFINMCCDLDSNHTNYFAIPDDPLADTLAYVRFCGGFGMFDSKIKEDG